MLLSNALLAMKARLLWAAERVDTFSNMSVLTDAQHYFHFCFQKNNDDKGREKGG